jgi:hypothetical protein
MKGWLLMTLGVLGVVLGAVWTLQGLDVLHDSLMSGVRIWSLIGPIVALIGLVLVVVGIRVRSRAKRRERERERTP